MADASVTLDTRIKDRMTDMLFQNIALSQGIVLINGLVVYLILYQYLQGFYLPAWLVTILVIALFRMLLARVYWKRRQDSKPARGLQVIFHVATCLSGLAWGLVVLVVPDNVIWMEAFTAFVIAGMSAGSLITNSARLIFSVSYLVFILAPLLVYYARIGDPPHLAMTAMVTFYMFLLIRLAFRINGMQYASIRSELENTDMYRVLKRAKQETDGMRLRLEKEVQNLPEELAQLNVFFDLSPNLLCIVDTSGRFIQTNPALREVTGMQVDNGNSETIFDYLQDNDAADLKNILQELKKDLGEIDCRLNLRYADDQYRPTGFHINFNNGLYYCAGREVDDK